MEAPRVEATESARELVKKLVRAHGPLLFHQSGGCCDGSAPMCYPEDDFLIGARDVLLGRVEGCPYYIGGDQWERWRHTRLVLDVMTREVFTTDPERSVQEVRVDLQRRHIRHVPVVAGDRVVAVLSLRDLMRADLREKRQDVRAMTAYIRGGFEQT